MTSPESSYREIPLTRGQVAIVDAADYEWLNQWKWFASKSSTGRFYATRSVFQGGARLLHREVLRLEPGDPRRVDHINKEPLDNRRANLRFATHMENMQNRRMSPLNRSGFKGIYYDGHQKRWRAEIKVNKKKIRLGWFKSPELAYAAYCGAARVGHGEFASLK